MKTLTHFLVGAVLSLAPRISGERTTYALENGTPTSLSVPGYLSSIHLPTVVSPSSFTNYYPQPIGDNTTFPPTTLSTIISAGVPSVTEPNTLTSFSMGEVTSGSLSSTALSLSLTYIRTSSTSSTVGFVNSSVPATGSTASTQLDTSTLDFPDSWSTYETSIAQEGSTSHFFSWPGRTTLITTTTSLYTSPYLGTSNTGSSLWLTINGTQSYAWPGSIPKPSQLSRPAFKTQQDDINTIQLQLFTPPPEIEARHIESQDYTPCTSENLFMGSPTKAKVDPSMTPFTAAASVLDKTSSHTH